MTAAPRRRRGLHASLHMDEAEVGRVRIFKLLGIHINEDLSWTRNTQHIVRKSQLRLYFLRRLRKFGMPAKILRNFYRGNGESVLTSSSLVWKLHCPGLEGSPVGD